MPAANSNSPGSTWLVFALMTVVSWGLYGIFLHSGQTAMADKSNGLYKSFLFVGLAYFLTAVLAPLGLLVVRGANWTFPVAGMGWSLIAGIVGAIGVLNYINSKTTILIFSDYVKKVSKATAFRFCVWDFLWIYIACGAYNFKIINPNL